jgi:hypothetical protein
MSTDKVTIMCTRHDPPSLFEQSPNKRLVGAGCRKCTIDEEDPEAAIEYVVCCSTVSPATAIKHAASSIILIFVKMDTVFVFHGSYWYCDPKV